MLRRGDVDDRARPERIDQVVEGAGAAGAVGGAPIGSLGSTAPVVLDVTEVAHRLAAHIHQLQA